MTKPFEPADGISGRWVKVADLVASRHPGDEVTYHELQELLGDVTREQAQAAVREAMRHLEKDGELSLRTVPHFGWVIMRPAEHITESDRYSRRVRSAARTSARKLAPLASRRGELSQFERQAADRAAARAQAVLRLTGRGRKTLDELASKSAQGRELPGTPGTATG